MPSSSQQILYPPSTHHPYYILSVSNYAFRSSLCLLFTSTLPLDISFSNIPPRTCHHVTPSQGSHAYRYRRPLTWTLIAYSSCRPPASAHARPSRYSICQSISTGSLECISAAAIHKGFPGPPQHTWSLLPITFGHRSCMVLLTLSCTLLGSYLSSQPGSEPLHGTVTCSSHFRGHLLSSPLLNNQEHVAKGRRRV